MGIFSELSRRVISGTALTIAVLTMPAAQIGIAHAETPVPAEKNPPGDIPDSQVFIDYTSKLGFTMKVPEGWARSDKADGARFVDKLDGVILTVKDVQQKPDVAMAKSEYVNQLKASARAVKVSAVKAVKLPSGEAIRTLSPTNRCDWRTSASSSTGTASS